MKSIELKQVSKRFKDGSKTIEALKSTDFSVDPGEFVAVIGPSGSGKSTFLTIIGGLQQPSEGNVFINDNKFSELKEKKRAQRRFKDIGFILQASNLVPFLTVQEQLKLVNKVEKSKIDKKRIQDLLQELDIYDLADKYPGELSGGERQRAAIARALYHDPAVILADEPTASLDTSRAIEVVKILARETKDKNKATIMVTHDERLTKYCDSVYVMEDGILEKQSMNDKVGSI
ncbi:hemin ABC transporter ATP-binding protein [Marinilactibacillus sp. 15R]|uniref:Putative hemin import ATP-binding protein HrtA n=1 Tax=Marinilactibacillus piezotolerans TaxID=258723 RepID=A0A1I3VNE8_9LACT|nr:MULTISPECIES: ABC transporter ATP-binding protein [Marinilactibacillus]API89279.1 hemin ABC transporter ATP-binding protein [Marinilactibacillus sp. 15R]SFJ96934.1 putative ABC transport system ATP-binding protein [Marinilactibacillus piezotolerans]